MLGGLLLSKAKFCNRKIVKVKFLNVQSKYSFLLFLLFSFQSNENFSTLHQNKPANIWPQLKGNQASPFRACMQAVVFYGKHKMLTKTRRYSLLKCAVLYGIWYHFFLLLLLLRPGEWSCERNSQRTWFSPLPDLTMLSKWIQRNLVKWGGGGWSRWV